MSEGLDEDATREYVAELVTAQLSGDGFQLHPEQVLAHTLLPPCFRQWVAAARTPDDIQHV